MNKGKKIWKSKTFWFNVAAAGLSLVMAKAGIVVDPALQGMVIGGGNTLLRVITKQPVNL